MDSRSTQPVPDPVGGLPSPRALSSSTIGARARALADQPIEFGYTTSDGGIFTISPGGPFTDPT
ncbi:hypothetical protein [Luteipulveratus mongoliensis]|uniref:Uncharacterized protein n=1 Tax=Luteipulveratus mongoliensis TaxID=571913 RepID=A0A0K1JNW5_9MICO|nr:hypothetical protein [Luteipulveratus mongoliensis]AKU18260.1 hypothetical protein VV02_24430 [Luteipulveratus mongoliensis]